ncbi:glutathione synthetase-like isoform X1 [Harpegnathos saltator]|uniref:glutathione synthetase-like isoform X1 n=1 Tax=Harpegnathos saltator TaxID=610380 RepID=UPI000DBED8F9|nr:glutathione synthetase-like isoform X1 [Harpegnathos saltator]
MALTSTFIISLIRTPLTTVDVGTKRLKFYHFIMSVCRLESCVQFPLSRKELKETVDKARDWALMHGLSMRSKKNFNRDQVQILPFALLPTSFPRKSFETAKSVQTLLNELIHKVAYNKEFIAASLKSTIKADPFTAELFRIYETVYQEGFSQRISLGLLRSDYLLHGDLGGKIKQVEINTIASSFAGIASITSQYHKYILAELGYTEKARSIPENNALTGFCNGLVAAWKLYNNKEAIILFVVEDVTYNICDQRFHEFEIRRLNPEIKVIRRSLTSLVSESTIKLGPHKELIVGNMIAAVVYYRSGYQLEAYPTAQEWDTRLLIERSRAIKCPSIQYHLAGTKKVQQSLAQSSILKKFLTDEESITKIQEVFAGLYTLDFTDDGEKALTMAMNEPSKYVLKPQREGGGNNVYNDDIKTCLNSMKNTKERTAYILMDRIYPPLQTNYLIRAAQEPISESNVSLSDVVAELGIYGVVVGDGKQIMMNEEVGHILRTKSSTENEGGIVAGVGALDSPYLIS